MNLCALLRLVALLLWFAACAPPHLVAKRIGRSRWPRRFMAGAARLCGAEVRVEGGPIAPRSLIVANHGSWLDIPVLCGATGCAFVAKAELRRHRLMRWIADQNGTIHVDRSERRAVREQAREISAALENGRPLAIFPEGTVSRDERLLPFRPSLLSAVAPPPERVEIRPVAIDYGCARGDLIWPVEESGVANFLRLLGRKGRIPATVRILPAIPPTKDRKALAEAARDAIASALGRTGL